RNLLTAIAETLNSMIQVFYLRRDGIPVDPTGGSAPRPAGEAVGVPTPRLAALERNPFVQRQFDRTDAIFAWLAPELPPGAFGLVEASLISALDWMDFRKTYPTERATGLAPLRAAWADRPSVAATRPDA